MAKDPAFLFYSSDFIIGTTFFTNEQIGKYVKLLCFQHQLGHLPESDMLAVCGERDEKIFSKFLRDEKGLYYNSRLEEESVKRTSFCQSRRQNASTSKAHAQHMPQHMENENEDENRDVIKDADEGVFNQKEQFEVAWAKYPVKDGKKASERSFRASVHNQVDMTRLMAAMTNYLKSEKVLKGFTKNGSTWFANWKDWETYVPPKNTEGRAPAEVIAVTCVAQGMKDSQIKIHMLEKGYSEHRIDEAIMRARGKVV